MTGGSLYTGFAAGLDLAAEWAGIDIKWQVEKDKRAHKFLKKNFPEVKKFYDAKDVGKENLEPVDIIIGGFPCQPFSKAGQQKGQSDHRYQWPNFIRIIEELRPAWVVAENVDGITNIWESPGNVYMEDKAFITYKVRHLLEIFRTDFERIGYTCDYYIIPASAVGAYHRRYRIFIVAYTTSDRRKIQMVSGQEKPISQQFIKLGKKGKINDVANTSCQQSAKQCTNIFNQAKKNEGKEQRENRKRDRCTLFNCCSDVSNTNCRGCKKPETEQEKQSKRTRRKPPRNYWKSEPPVGRVVNGFSGRVAELEGLGLAVVPQVAYLFLKPIVEIFNNMKNGYNHNQHNNSPAK